MTRFARYSTQGIRKPPCEATPWSELAPPAAAGSATVAAASDAKQQDEKRRLKPDMAVPAELSTLTTASMLTGSKKAKKISAKKLGNADAPVGNPAALKMNDKQLKVPHRKKCKGIKKMKKAMQYLVIGSANGETKGKPRTSFEPEKPVSEECCSPSVPSQVKRMHSKKIRRPEVTFRGVDADLFQVKGNQLKNCRKEKGKDMKKMKKAMKCLIIDDLESMGKQVEVTMVQTDTAPAMGVSDTSKTQAVHVKAKKGKNKRMVSGFDKSSHQPKKRRKILRKCAIAGTTQGDEMCPDDVANARAVFSTSADDSHSHHPDMARDSTDPEVKLSKSAGSRPDTEATKRKKKHKKTKKVRVPSAERVPPLLAESRLMTRFEGYWVRRRAVPRLERVRAELAAAISDPLALKREMKKRKRAEHRLLLSALVARAGPATAAGRIGDDDDGGADDPADDAAQVEVRQEPTASIGDASVQQEQAAEAAGSAAGRQAKRSAERAPAPTDGAGEQRAVKFDGVWMTADAVGRLKELRRQLKLQRVSEHLLKQTMKTARRREEMKRKRDAKKVCLSCRKPGHVVSECTQRRTDDGAPPVTGLCFRCGSTEHRLQECRRRPADGALPYAVCFVCGRTGHLSRDCPLNPNGVYPRGGACKVCQQRSHLADDCPERKRDEAAAGAPRLATLAAGAAVEDDYEHDFSEPRPAKDEPRPVKDEPAVGEGRQPRVVTF